MYCTMIIHQPQKNLQLLILGCQVIVKKLQTNIVVDVMKLIPSLGDKINFALHYKNLQLYLSLKMKLTKIHKVLKFKQSEQIKKYINFNTKKRTYAGNSFEKDFFKLMINSAYDKTMKNLQKRIRLVNNDKDFFKYTSRPTHITHKIFDKDYAAIHKIKPVLMFTEPIYIGFTILGISKWLIYDFLLFTDTDILTYEIKSKDVYKEFF